jgi:pimeloyl-ACP methyl ester carboxylesterase
MMSQTIVFVHGAWVTPLCWEKFQGFYDGKGFNCIAPAWPYKDGPIADLQRNPPAEFGRLGITEIVDHYDQIIRGLSEPPILIGHSFGGLFVQMLLDRGLGSAGVAIDSAPPKSVLPFFYPSTVRSSLGVLLTPGGWGKVVRQSFSDFQYAFVHKLPADQQKAAYDKYVVPETGRIFFQAAFATLNNVTRVNFRNDQRAPLLMIAGAADRNVTAAMNRVNFRRYQGSQAVTEFKEFENRCHWIIAQDGWEEVAGYIAGWLGRLPGK